MPPPEERLHHNLYRVTHHKAFHITLYILIALDMVNVTLAVVSEFIGILYSRRNIFRGINIIFVCTYIVNVALKVSYISSQYHTDLHKLVKTPENILLIYTGGNVLP